MTSLLCLLFIHGLVIANAFPLRRSYTLHHRSFLVWQSVDHLTSSSTASTIPTVLPFDAKDFTRDDVPLPSSNNTLEDSKKIVASNLKQFEHAERRKVWRRSYLDDEEEEYEYYRSPNVEQEEGEEEPIALINSNTTNSVASTAQQSPPTWSSFLVDLYVDKPGDGRKRRQARFVVRSITTISVLIGVTFSLICYLAPGKFVTFRGSGASPVEDNRFFFDDTVDGSSPSTIPQLELPLKPIEGRLEGGKELPSPINPRVPLSSEVGGKESVAGRSAEI